MFIKFVIISLSLIISTYWLTSIGIAALLWSDIFHTGVQAVNGYAIKVSEIDKQNA